MHCSVSYREAEGVGKNFFRDLKRDAVLLAVEVTFLLVPLEAHAEGLSG
jgi:hypothetical protein